MKHRNDPPEPTQPAVGSPAPRKRFRIQKLEDRIAPKKGGKGTNNCGYDSSNTMSGSGTY